QLGSVFVPRRVNDSLCATCVGASVGAAGCTVCLVRAARSRVGSEQIDEGEFEMTKGRSLTVDGKQHRVEVDESDMPLLYVLRDELGMNNPRFGCGLGQCGACTVHINGEPVRSCVTPLSAVENAAVTTLPVSVPKKGRTRCRWRGLQRRHLSAATASM